MTVELDAGFMGDMSLGWVRRETVRYVAWALAWGYYLVAVACHICRTRGVRPRYAAIMLAMIAVSGIAATAASTGWRVETGIAAQESARVQALERQLTSAQADLARAKASLVALSTPQPVAAADNPRQATIQIAALEASLRVSEKQRRELRELYQQTLSSLEKSDKERESLAAIKSRLERRVASLETADRANISERRAESLAEPSVAETASVPDDEASGADTSFDVRRFLARLGVRPSGEGGPFVPAGSMRRHGADPQAMRILRSLPLTAPLAHYVIASPFGVRADPINEHEAFHTGVDLDAPYRSPVFNTAPGVVVFAGWAGTYGRMVEIDHGHGVHTRYCHLNRITVTVGETLRHRVRIGLLGSTGRSTGPHVHYEVRVNGIPEDPEKFMRAGRSVVLVGDNR